MPYSMTGFGTAEIVLAPLQLNWEIRSVNHRFLELGFRLPEELRELETVFRDLATGVISRGKVDCTLKVSLQTGEIEKAIIDSSVLAELQALEARVRAEFPDAGALSAAEILRWPGVLRQADASRSAAALATPAKTSFTAAIDALREARSREGRRIAETLESRNEAIAALLETLRPLLAGAQERLQRKLTERVARLDVQAQPERLEQELALLAQRCDVAEEVDRLASHVAEVRDVLKRDEPIGRRLDFLIQELNREANTLASKVQDDELTKHAVDLKVIIEQMREQVQNLE